MPPQFISFGPFMLNLYTLLIALAVLTPLVWHWFRHRDARVFAVALVVAAFALAFGRAGYVALNWEYFREHHNEILALSGLSEHTAIMGVVIACCVLRVASSHYAIRDTRYAIAYLFALIVIAASLGCIPNGCAYGREVFWQTDGERSLAWLLHADWPDATLVNNPRWPTQALLAVWMTACAILVPALTRRRGDKGTGRSQNHFVILSPLHLVVLFAVGDFLVQFLHGEAAVMLGGLRIYQWFDVALAGLVIALTSMRLWRNSKQNRLLRADKFG